MSDNKNDLTADKALKIATDLLAEPSITEYSLARTLLDIHLMGVMKGIDALDASYKKLKLI